VSEEIRDLVTSRAWKEVCGVLDERRSKLVNQLITTGDHLSLMRLQAKIQMIDYFVNLPHEFLEKE